MRPWWKGAKWMWQCWWLALTRNVSLLLIFFPIFFLSLSCRCECEPIFHNFSSYTFDIITIFEWDICARELSMHFFLFFSQSFRWIEDISQTQYSRPRRSTCLLFFFFCSPGHVSYRWDIVIEICNPCRMSWVRLSAQTANSCWTKSKKMKEKPPYPNLELYMKNWFSKYKCHFAWMNLAMICAYHRRGHLVRFSIERTRNYFVTVTTDYHCSVASMVNRLMCTQFASANYIECWFYWNADNECAHTMHIINWSNEIVKTFQTPNTLGFIHHRIECTNFLNSNRADDCAEIFISWPYTLHTLFAHPINRQLLCWLPTNQSNIVLVICAFCFVRCVWKLCLI